MRFFRPWVPLAFLLPLPAQATSFADVPFPESVQDAPVIVRGKVGMTYTDWAKGPDAGRRIYTFIEIRIDEVLKGEVASKNSVIAREIGGEKDGVGMQVAGAAEFRKGEEVVVFLGTVNDDGSHDVRGMMMGKYNIARDANGEEVLVGAGVSPMTPPALRRHMHANQGQDDTPSVRKWTLADLRELIREQARAAAPSPAAPNPKPAPTVAASQTAPQAAEPRSEPPAPALQPSLSRGPLAIGLLTAAAVTALLWAVFRRR